ncbi:SDR family NAD(P)-dependent oxidoreductase [Chloroflexota bacterium]
MYDLSGKVALVTGASGRRGVGHAIAVRLASEGADVAVTDKNIVIPREAERVAGWQGLESVAQEIQSLGSRSLVLTADITQSQQVNEMVGKVVAELGHIDILVNNAGIGGPRNSPVIDMEDEEWLNVLTVNLTGAFYCCRAVGKKMIEQGKGGAIVNISSISGKIATPGAFDGGKSAYCASKFGLIGLTQDLAIEFAPHQIKVNAICPGSMRTDSMTALFRDEAKRQRITEEEAEAQYYQEWLRRSPLHRRGNIEEVAGMVAFLCSGESDYILGQSINVDGGFLMAH